METTYFFPAVKHRLCVTHRVGFWRSVPIAVICKRVVAGKSQKNAEPRTQREEDLSSSVHPHLENRRRHFSTLPRVCSLGCCRFSYVKHEKSFITSWPFSDLTSLKFLFLYVVVLVTQCNSVKLKDVPVRGRSSCCTAACREIWRAFGGKKGRTALDIHEQGRKGGAFVNG